MRRATVFTGFATHPLSVQHKGNHYRNKHDAGNAEEEDLKKAPRLIDLVFVVRELI